MDMYQLNQVPSEAQIRKILKRIVFGTHVYCPVCKGRKVYAVQGRYRCRKCRLRFSLLSHTWLANMRLPLPQFWWLLWCWTTQVPVRQTVSLTKLSEPTVRHWFDQFRHHLPEQYQELEKLVQMDEAYFGGKHGRALLMGKQPGTRKLAWQLLPHTHPTREHATWYLQSYDNPDSQLTTHGASIYKQIHQ